MNSSTTLAPRKISVNVFGRAQSAAKQNAPFTDAWRAWSAHLLGHERAQLPNEKTVSNYASQLSPNYEIQHINSAAACSVPRDGSSSVFRFENAVELKMFLSLYCAWHPKGISIEVLEDRPVFLTSENLKAIRVALCLCTEGVDPRNKALLSIDTTSEWTTVYIRKDNMWRVPALDGLLKETVQAAGGTFSMNGSIVMKFPARECSQAGESAKRLQVLAIDDKGSNRRTIASETFCACANLGTSADIYMLRSFLEVTNLLQSGILPNVAITDLQIGGKENGVDVASEIMLKNPGARVYAYTFAALPPEMAGAFRGKMNKILLKNDVFKYVSGVDGKMPASPSYLEIYEIMEASGWAHLAI